MSDIKRLLNKKGWTGRELGQIELANMAYMFSQQIQGKAPTPLVTQGEFRKMLNTLKDPIQGGIYNDYIKIHEWLNITYNITSGQEQQAQSNFKTLLNHITVAQALEETYAYIDKLPVIMTEKQYKDYVEKRTEEIVNPQDGGGCNLFNMFIEALYCLVNQLQTQPRKANPLKALKPKLEAQRVKDPRILSRYNEVMRHGYYTIDETGQRSDSMTPEEWQRAIETPELAQVLASHEEGEVPPTVYERVSAVARATFDGATEEEIKAIEGKWQIACWEGIGSLATEEEIKAIKAIEGKYNLVKACTFHLYEEPPEDLNRWEILQTGDLGEYYRSLWNNDPDGEGLTEDNYIQATIADIEAFRKEYPKVFEAVLKDMRKYIGDAVDTPIEEWANTVYSWADLYKAHYYRFNEEYVGDTQIFDGNSRAIFNGIAILQQGTFNGHTIDDNGYYKAPNVLGGLTALAPLSLEALFTDDPDYASNAEGVETARENLIDSYYFMLGFNTAIDLIAQYYSVPQLEVFKFDTARMAARMGAFNTLTAMLYKEIKERAYEDKELQAKKLEVLKDFFYPIGYEELVVPQENIDKTIELFKDGGAFGGAKITDLLCRRYEEGVEHEQ